MVNRNLAGMSVQQLMGLREQVVAQLELRRVDLEEQLERIGGADGAPRGRRGRVSPMRGQKVAPKYRGPGSETWAGRGVTRDGWWRS